jgi:hypothetical protein
VRVQETTTRTQRTLEKLEPFSPAAQEQDRRQEAAISTHITGRKSEWEQRKSSGGTQARGHKTKTEYLLPTETAIQKQDRRTVGIGRSLGATCVADEVLLVTKQKCPAAKSKEQHDLARDLNHEAENVTALARCQHRAQCPKTYTDSDKIETGA